jgi:ChrB-like protein
VVTEADTGLWVLLCYRLPREPSTPRITVWRKLKRLGVAQLCDGLVTLPGDARTREQLEWIADEITEAGGEASIWLAHPASAEQERELAGRMASARAGEYAAIATEATTAASAASARLPETRRTADRLRAELRRIARRDYFSPPERDTAHAAVRALLDQVAPAGSDDTQELPL